MRYRRVQVCGWPWGFPLSGSRPVLVPVVRFYSDVPNPNPKAPGGNRRSGTVVVKERALTALQNAAALGRHWGQRSAQTASATLNYWWSRYEEFVGINEVREAQTKVTQAEADFMVSRSAVREAHLNVEALLLRLKEVRERLDRVSREEPHYLDLATKEHKLLQEDRRLRTAYELAESSEREKFSLFSAAVRESHEKERTRAERTKNWSVFGSVLGALIGVMGSTYINRVRLQELKTLLLEAQKGPESLQEALRIQAGNHRVQQDELGALIDRMRLAMHNLGFTSTEAGPKADPNPSLESVLVLKDLHEGQRDTEKRLGELKEGLDSLQNDVSAVKTVVETQKVFVKADRTKRVEVKGGEAVGLSEIVLVKSLEETQRTLSERLRANTVYNAVLVYTASAVTVSLLFLLLKGGAS